MMRNLKIVLALLSLVAIGFVAGFHTHRYLAVRDISRVAAMRSPESYREALLKAIQADDRQRAELEPIMLDYSNRIGAVFHESRQRRRELADSMYAAMRLHLSAPQVKLMEEFAENHRRRHYRGHKPPGQERAH
jgi:hypothetical protein